MKNLWKPNEPVSFILISALFYFAAYLSVQIDLGAGLIGAAQKVGGEKVAAKAYRSFGSSHTQIAKKIKVKGH